MNEKPSDPLTILSLENIGMLINTYLQQQKIKQEAAASSNSIDTLIKPPFKAQAAQTRGRNQKIKLSQQQIAESVVMNQIFMEERVENSKKRSVGKENHIGK